MEKIPGKRIGTSLYVDVETGHLYRRHNSKGQRQYMTCCKERCSGSGIYVEEGNTFQRTKEHHHEPDRGEIALRQLVGQLKQRAETEPVKAETIFQEECQRFGTSVRFQSIKRTMERYRSKGRRENPQLGELLDAEGENTNISDDGTNRRKRGSRKKIKIPVVQVEGVIVSDHSEYSRQPQIVQPRKKQVPVDSDFVRETQEAFAALHNELAISRAAAMTATPEDKWDVFGKFIANELRALDQEELQTELKKKITALVMDPH